MSTSSTRILTAWRRARVESFRPTTRLRGFPRTAGQVAMVKHNVLVRRLAAVETLGSASVLCLDFHRGALRDSHV